MGFAGGFGYNPLAKWAINRLLCLLQLPISTVDRFVGFEKDNKRKKRKKCLSQLDGIPPQPPAFLVAGEK